MIKQAMVAGSVCLTLLMGAVAWSAPKAGGAKAVKAAPLDEIRVSTDDGGRGGAQGGSGESWTLRSNNTMDHSESVSTFDSVALGAEGVNHVNGAMPEGSYAGMLDYLQWTRLLDIKSPSSEGAGVSIELVRNGKKKSVRLPFDGRGTVSSAIWTTLTLLNGLEERIDWKNAQGLSLNTGVFVRFNSQAEGLPEFTPVNPPVVAILDGKGKQAGQASVHSAAWADRVVLAPGTYKVRLDFAKAPEGFIWRATPETIVVSAGRMTDVEIGLEKKVVGP